MTDAEKTVQKMMEPVLRFALKRCRCAQDAEDLAQEILCRAYAALCRGGVEDGEKFVWTIAHNALANYYRGEERRWAGLSAEDAAELASRGVAPDESVIGRETAARLAESIAHLSALRRKIVVGYYYDNKPLRQIAAECAVPVGTVKWHLFEAKRELKGGMEKMQEQNRLQFDPVRFSLAGFSGSAGTMGGTGTFFRSALAQNIAYCTYRKAKTAAEISEELGVSPVYVESEAEFLEKYGYLLRSKGGYLANILIDDADGRGERIDRLMDAMYAKAARAFAGELCARLLASGLLESGGIECAQREDKNFLLWALLPYIAANSGKVREEISFEEAAVRRIDGSHDIAYAVVEGSRPRPLRYFRPMQQWCGPSMVCHAGQMLWKCIFGEVCGERKNANFSEDFPAAADLKLLARMERGERLSADEYALLAQRGIVRMEQGEPKLLIVRIKDEETNARLLSLGTELKKECESVWAGAKEEYVQAVLADTPKHLRRARAFMLQYLFSADGWFLIYVLKDLMESGRLRQPAEEQKKSLMTVIAPVGD